MEEIHSSVIMRRNEELANSGINFNRYWVSGGEGTRLKGPSIMPGGQKDAYDLVAPILEEIPPAKSRRWSSMCASHWDQTEQGHCVKWF